MNESFISYSRSDSEFVQRLHESFSSLGIDPWIDWQDIPAASKWQQEILVGIQFAQNFIYVISPASIQSEYCNWELDQALSHNKRIIPIVAIECPPSSLRESIKELNWIFFRDFTKGLNDLVHVLDSPLGITYGDRLDSRIKISDPFGSRTFPLYRNQYRCGRNPTGSFAEAGLLRLGDSEVSRCHASFVRRNNIWHIVDGFIRFFDGDRIADYKASSNGIRISKLVDGRMIPQEKLKPLYLRPLSSDEVMQLSFNTSILYEEICSKPPEIEEDEHPTFSG